MTVPTDISSRGWQFCIDRGGTFTDVIARHPDGRLFTHKLLSENPEQYEDAAIQGINEMLERYPSAQGASIDSVKMGTTVATNALLERRGDRTLLVVNRGFRDILRIAYQARPEIFARQIRLPSLLHEDVLEVSGRISASGEELDPLDLEAARAAMETRFARGIRSIAIVLMFSYLSPKHEQALGQLARAIGFTQVSESHAVSPLMKLVSRGDTTVVDAYLSPLLRRYVSRIADALGDPGLQSGPVADRSVEIRVGKEAEAQTDAGPRLLFMQSSGGLAEARHFHGKDSILSGPAGGIVGAVRSADRAGFRKLITFDMGGTSTDVAHFAGEYERSFETLVAGVRMRAPMMRIHTVAAGGGSILSFDGARFRVGPESAGANPGPACYRRGGPLTVTDCNVLLGRLQPEYFPRVFGSSADLPIDPEPVRRGFEEHRQSIREGSGKEMTAEEVAEGFLRIAVENMAGAIKKISVQRGYDVTEYTLSCFGGAGGQHACRVADALGMTRVLLHPHAGVLSALGIGMAEVRDMRQESIEMPLEHAEPALGARLSELGRACIDSLVAQGIAEARVRLHKRVHLRYEGSDSSLELPYGSREEMDEAFAQAHRRRYGFTLPDRGLIVETAVVEGVGGGGELSTEGGTGLAEEIPPARAAFRLRASRTQPPLALHPVHFGGARRPTPFYDRQALAGGAIIPGPAVILEPTGTNVVELGWQAEVAEGGDLLLTRIEPLERKRAAGTEVDPVLLEIFNNLFMSIAEQMGATLENTSRSVNIKERLDFSCAIFDPEGNLVANAPHMPVHLGSMSESVRAIVRERTRSMRPGDVYVLNAPYNGGTHLPDITVITPVFDAEGRSILFFVGSRGHHADVGGITPGSMPSDSRTVLEEGVLLDNEVLVDQGRFCGEEIRARLESGPYPARNPARNLADLEAQIAANEKGVAELRKMVEHYGLEVVHAYMSHVQDNAEEQVRRVIERLEGGSFRAPLDNGAEIRVAVRIDRAARSAVIDFSGTSPQREDNFNAPKAVCRAAVLYVFRTLVDEDIPLNEGCLEPLDIRIPEGSMLAPRYPAAVVAGNVETSQVITDALYGALHIQAAAQGTMNNLTFGNDRLQYYETLCGGSGAGPGYDGTSAVHTHMTNSRLTDPEVLEWRFPVRLEEFSIARGTGGRGKWRGGDGVLRRIRFLEPMTVSILSNRRKVRPFGLEGGEAGAPGENWVEQAGIPDRRQTDRAGTPDERQTDRAGTPDERQTDRAGTPDERQTDRAGTLDETRTQRAGISNENPLGRPIAPREALEACCRIQGKAGDAVVIRTPGGGGFGSIRPLHPDALT